MLRATPSATVALLASLVVASVSVSVSGLGCSKDRKPSGSEPPPAGSVVAPGVASAVAFATAPAATADAAPPASRGPLNVILISIDSLRADMPWAGYARPIAPRLTRFHARSVAYTRAYSTSSYTSKSVAGLLTGRYPSELLRTGNFFTKYLTPGDFVCTSLAAQEIPCVAGHAHAYFGKGNSGFESGFRAWELVPEIPFNYETDPYITSPKLTKLAIATLTKIGEEARGEHPFFAWFHFMDPHDEYKTHAESTHYGKSPRDLYDEEVFYTDLWFGRLLDFIEAQPWAARTAIVITADHGEAFGEHGITRHAHEVWEELVHVPLFVHLPGAEPRIIETPRGAVDLAPTFIELLGGRPIASLPGTSLVEELRGGAAPARDVIVDLPEDEYNERRRALVHGRTKLIAFGADVRFALFDLEADPREAEDLIRKRPELAVEMKQLYKDASKRIIESPPKGGIPKKDK